jgi:hypothetical protein
VVPTCKHSETHSHKNEIQAPWNPSRNRDWISSKKMRLRQNVQACGMSSFITTITHPWSSSNSFRSVFHIATLDALALTLVVHTKGKGIAGTYTFEVAEQKQCEVLLMAKIEEHPLRVEVERA